MRSNLLRLLIILCVAHACTSSVEAQPHFSHSNYIVKHFTPANGLGSVQTRGFMQDSLGYMWIASFDGLSRFDGYNFKLYKFQHNFSNSGFSGGIQSLNTDRNGNLWVISDVLSKYQRDTDTFIDYHPTLNPKVVSRFSFNNKDAIIWMAIPRQGLFAFDLITDHTLNYLNHHPDSLTALKRNAIWGISDRDSILLLGTRDGLWQFSKTKKTFTRPHCNSKDSSYLFSNPIWNIFSERDYSKVDGNTTWLMMPGKLVKIDESFLIVDHFDFPTEFQSIDGGRDENGLFWFMTGDNELYQYDPFNKTFKEIHIETDEDPFIFRGSIFIDRRQSIWTGSESDGVHQFIRKSLVFHNSEFRVRGTWAASTLYTASGKEYLISMRVMGGTDNELWTANPIVSANIDSIGFRKLPMRNPPEGIIMSIRPGKSNLWVCSFLGGITRLPIDRESGQPDPDKGVKLMSAEHNPNLISNANNGYIYEDEKQNLWIASRGMGITKVVSELPYGTNGSVERFKHDPSDSNSLLHDFALKIYGESDDSQLILTWGGLDLLKDGKFQHIFRNAGTRTILKTNDSTILIGTINGLYEATKAEGVYRISKNNLLKNMEIYDMAQDANGRIWIINPLVNELVCFDPKTNLSITFNANDGLPPGIIDVFVTAKGSMVFAGSFGFSIINPLSLKINSTNTVPVLTSLKINNQTAQARSDRAGEFFLEKNIEILNKLTLDYLHDQFSIEFSAMDLTSPEKNRYRHFLQGYDQDWIETDASNRTVTYTNLDAGVYTLKVRSSNHQGIWSDEERSLIIVVLPPPWESWWAYSLYTIALVLAIVSWRIYDLKRTKLKHRAEHLAEVDRLKTRFFTNISHEFRTPITLIIGALKTLSAKANTKEDKEELSMMTRNSQRLLRLINQLLDLSKIESGKMQLTASHLEVVQFLRDNAASYESLAAGKKIKYIFYSEIEKLYVYADLEKLENVISNLLSNAFKFTNPGGEVMVNVRLEKNHCNITVKDTGIGIPSDQLDKVFDRFYQVDASQTRNYEGSGLGMALAKELVELHKGKITVQSEVGKGTTFTVALLLGKDHLEKVQIAELEGKTPVHISPDTVPDPGVIENDRVETDGASVVLIVEDNGDMRNYIRKSLSDKFRILEAANGKIGLHLAEQSVPDLVISDIMMPEMDGYELCRLIKSHELTCHIPVILLTAKADRESKIAGLEMQADDYLSKPFDADELKLIVRNRIAQRKQMREAFSREIILQPKQIAITSLDEKFLSKVLTIVEDHLADENFSIEELSRQAGYSTMHFYRKLKALTDQTPSTFLRVIRLKRAAELLAKNSDNVSQIAYSVGFSSLSYFNKCFKEQFGVTPGQFAIHQQPK